VIEETGVVVAREGDSVWVETERRSACGGCESEKGCGTGLLAQVFGSRPVRVRAKNPVGADTGELVVIGLEEAAFLQSSVVLYLIPILGLLLGAALGAKGPGGHAELSSIVAGALGLVGGLLWARRFSTRAQRNPRFQATVIRNLSIGHASRPIQFPSRSNRAVS